MSVGESASVAQQGAAVKMVQWVSGGGGKDEQLAIEVRSYISGGCSVNKAALPV